MTKAQRMIEEHMKQVDAVCEILDARIRWRPQPDIDHLAGDKPRIVVLNQHRPRRPEGNGAVGAPFSAAGND